MDRTRLRLHLRPPLQAPPDWEWEYRRGKRQKVHAVINNNNNNNNNSDFKRFSVATLWCVVDYSFHLLINIAKGTTDPRAEFKFKHKSNFIFRILNKHQLQNLNQSSAFRLNSNIKILNELSFTISTKIKFHNLNQASAAKYWPIFSCKISPELQLQNLGQTLCSKSEQKIDFMTKLQLPDQHQTVANTFLSINI